MFIEHLPSELAIFFQAEKAWRAAARGGVYLDAALIEGFVRTFLMERFDRVVATPLMHRAMWEIATSQDPLVAIAAPRGHAKAQSINELVLTPNGWYKVGWLKVGDFLFGSDGQPTKIIQLHPIEFMKFYRMTTRTGRTVRCNAEHLWTVTCPSNTGDRQITKSLAEIALNYRSPRIDKRDNSKHTECRYFIYPSAPIEFEPKELPIDPYTLGLWLGDGTSSSGDITAAEPEVFDYVPYIVEKKKPRLKYTVKGLSQLLRENGLKNNKHIPEIYFRASIQQRQALLQGLMDSDGHAPLGQKRTEWCSIKKRLADDYVALVRSLGGRANISKGRAKLYDKDCGIAYNVISMFPPDIKPFHLKRKLNAYGGPGKIREAIIAIEEAGEDFGRCISVDAADGLYITNDYLVTHNSTAMTLAYTLAAMLFKQRDYGIIVSDTEAQAAGFLHDINVELTENDLLKAGFRIKGLVKENETELICEMEDKHLFKITAKGAEQKVRGLKWRGKRPNFILLDDVENDESVLNRDRREKLRNWILNALLPAGSDDCVVRMVGTILHLDAALARFLDDKGWTSLCLDAHSDDFRHLLWKEKFPRARLEALRERYLRQNNPEGYAMEYRNQAVDSSTSFFRKSDFKPLSEIKGPRERYAAIDFAISLKERADYTAIPVAETAADGILRIVDMRRGHWDAAEIIDEMFSVQRAYTPELFIAEDGVIEKSIGPFLNAEMMRRKVYLNITTRVPIKDKMSRAQSFKARMRGGGVEFDTNAPWFPALQSELLAFPRGRYDDQVDSLAWLGLFLDEIAEVDTEEEDEAAKYNREYVAAYSFGRNPYTGY